MSTLDHSKISKMLLAALLLLLITQECRGLTMNSVSRLPQMDFSQRTVLDQFGSYVMMWSPLEEEILIEVQVRTRGYVGLGFSPNGGMKDADIVIGWVDDEGIVHFSDRFALGNRTPVEDEIQNYKLLGGSANDTHTIIRFSRPWITCDFNYDFIITGDTVRVIWAYDALQPDPTKTTLRYHDHRGVKSLYLKEPKLPDPPPLTRVQSWDIRAPEVELPSDLNTLYWCKLYKIPNLPWKHQVVGFVPVIEQGSLPHVHHMLLYECSLPNSDEHLEKWVQHNGAQCYSKNMPISWTACGTPMVAWAIGSHGEMLPDHVGFALGEKHGGSTYFLLEIHYDNPNLKKGVVDSSGLRLLLTDKVRPHDAGVLTIGHKVEPSMIIPPNTIWSTTAHCTADCTQKTIPDKGINVFSGILHAHLLGHAIFVNHIRNGKELEPLVADNSYDFNYQQSRFFSKERNVKPGDHLVTTCVYNATRRTTPTFGGFGTDDEMCLVFLSYYPRLNLGECYSRPDLAVLFDVFGIQNLYENDRIMSLFSQDHFDVSRINSMKEDMDLETMKALSKSGSNSESFKLVDFFRIINISEPEKLRGKSFYEILTDEQTWRDAHLVNKLKEAISSYQYEPSCLYSGRGMVHGLPKKAKIPHFMPYQSPKQSCVPSYIERNSLEAPFSILEETSSVAERKYGGSNARSTSVKENIANQQSSLKGQRGSAITNTPASVISLLLFVALMLSQITNRNITTIRCEILVS